MVTGRAQREQEDNEASILRGAMAGLLAGVIASFAMDRFQTVLTAFSLWDSDEEPTTNKAADAISNAWTGHELAERDKPIGGQIAHYTLGASIGLLYGIVAEYHPEVTKNSGTAFGIGVAVVLDEAMVPPIGLANVPWKTSASGHLLSMTSHLIFGAVIEWTRRQIRATLVQGY